MFSKNQVYRRKEIHDRYGGGRQGGISTPANALYIFIFSGSGGQKHGYVDKWVNKDVYAYSGEGQVWLFHLEIRHQARIKEIFHY